MDEEKIKLEIRLWALETLLSYQWAAMHVQSGNPAKSIKTLGDQLKLQAKNTTFPALGAASSDLVSAELEDAIGWLITLQRKILKIPE